MKNIFKKWGLIFLLLTTGACSLDGDLDNPNQISVSGADVDLLMNGIQLSFADFFYSANTTVGPLVRMQAMTGGWRYQTNYNPTSLDGIWSQAYRNILVNIQTMMPLVEEKGLTTHVAVGKILEAYTWITLVDIFGDVPQAEALDPSNFNPATTSGADIYTYALGLLEEAKTELAKTGTEAGGALSRDIYYGGNRAKWNALANTIELKAYMNLGNTTKVAEYVNTTTGASVVDIIDTDAEEFTYKYSNTTVPNSRHPLYNQYYGPGAGQAGGYWANYYLHECFGKWVDSDFANTVEDPRWRYYFFRQVGSISPTENGFDVKALGCTPGATPPVYVAWGGGVYCVFEPGFYGRDHGDASGTPPDGPVMTCAGVYPAGGLLDNTSTAQATYQKQVKRGDGGDGKGIQPIWMAFFTDYIKAEIVNKAGNTATAKTLLASAIDHSITRVRAMATASSQALSTGREPSTSAYQAAVASLFDAAANKQDVIGKEYWIALNGNGLEAYNLYRRTSAPKNMQPTIQVSTDPYFRSMIYPATYANLNSSAVQKDAGAVNKVFWDTNPDNLN